MAPKYLPPNHLGTPIKQISTFHSLAVEYANKRLLCFVVNGHSACFNIVDLDNYQVVFSKPLKGAESSWELIRFQDQIFIAGTGDIGCFGHLYSCHLDSYSFKEYGVVLEGEKFLWSMTSDEKENIYIGTWPNGKIVRFNVESETFTDFGTIVKGQNYLRSLVYLNGSLYAGVGSKGAVVKFNIDTKEKTHLETAAAPLLGLKPEELPFCYELEVADPYILAYFSTEKNELLAYNTQTDSWQYLVAGYKGMMLKEPTGNVLYTTNTGLYRFNHQSGQVELINNTLRTGFKGGGLLNNKIYSCFFNGTIMEYQLPEGPIKQTPSPAEGQATQIQTIFLGPDNYLYFSAYPGGTGAKVNKETGETERFSLEQAEGMGSLGNSVFMGIYPHGHLYELDTTKPINKDKNPQEVYLLGKYQDRPFALTSGAGKLFIGTIPYYGRLGGGIAIYDPETKKGETYAPIVEDLSVASLLYYEGRLFGGTTIYGGLGIEPTKKHALMFEWDVGTKTLVRTFLPLPDADITPMISGLCQVGNLIYGTFNGYIFAYDPKLQRTIKYRNIYPEVTRYGHWRPVYTKLGKDGLLYSNLGGKITIIDPLSLSFETVGSSDLMAIDDDCSIYYAKGCNLYKLTKEK